jgi:hypothetical protein
MLASRLPDYSLPTPNRVASCWLAGSLVDGSPGMGIGSQGTHGKSFGHWFIIKVSPNGAKSAVFKLIRLIPNHRAVSQTPIPFSFQAALL